MSEPIIHIPTTDPAVCAFRIVGEVGEEQMQTMAEIMNAAFDAHDTVRMLLVFERYDGSTLGARLNFEGLKAQLRALSKIEKYVVVGAPDEAEKMIATAGSWTGIETATFDRDEEPSAWRFVGAEMANAA